MGKIYTKLFFSFPSCFIFTVVTPLHFTHLYHLISCNPSQCIKNLAGVLSISQILLNTKVLNWQLLFRYPETFLQLRYMKDIMNIHEMIR
jgi:hypothetical protein